MFATSSSSEVDVIPFTTVLWAHKIQTRRAAPVGRFLNSFVESELMQNLPENCQRGLYYLASLIEQDGTRKAVYPKKKTIAEAIGKSVKTVYDILSKLENLKLIKRIKQTQSGFGRDQRFAEGLIELSEDIYELFDESVEATRLQKIENLKIYGVVKDHAQPEAKVQPEVHANSESSDTLNNPPRNDSARALLKTENLEKSNSATSITPSFTPASPTGSVTNDLSSAALSKDKEGTAAPVLTAAVAEVAAFAESPAAPVLAASSDVRLPADLQWLTAHMKALDVVGLMSVANRYGKQLQDVLTAKNEALKAGLATGKIKNLWGYLLHLLKTDIDYAWVVKQAVVKKEEKKKIKTEKNEFEAMKQEFAGRNFRNEKGTEFNVTSNGQFCYIQYISEKKPRCEPVNIDLFRHLKTFKEIVI